MNAELLDRLPPSDARVEMGLLGAIALKPRVLDDVAEIIQPDDFYADANRRLYLAFQAMHAARVPFGNIAVASDWLKKSGEYEVIGGAAYLAECLTSEPTAAHAVHYAGIIARHAKMRAIIHAATEALRDAYDPTATPEGVIDTAGRAFAEVAMRENERDGYTAQEAVQAALDNIDEISEHGGLGLATGFRTFDEQIGGLFPAELAILGARSSVGKTALAMQIAQWNAAKGRLVYFVTLEMSMVNLIQRELCAAASVDSLRLRGGTLTEQDRAAIIDQAAKIATRALVVDDRPMLKTSDIARKARRLAGKGLRLVIVDYTQFVTPENPKEVREQQIARISRDLKALAKELNVAVLAMAALNKEADKQGSSRLSHLRESDAVGYTADMVMTLDRGEKGISVSDADRDKGKLGESNAFWKVLKNRNGPIGKIELDWIAWRTRFACRGEQPPDPLVVAPTNRETAFDAFSGERHEF